MKTVKKILLSLSFAFLSAFGFAQNSQNLNEIDSRARLRYSETDILNMTPVQLAQINFIFQNSFVINQDKPCPECPAIDLNKIDVSTMQRNLRTRARYYQTVPGHPIDLLSIEELDAELQRIQNELSTGN